MPEIGRTHPYARPLRRNATDVERRMWQALRGRQLGGFKFRRQATIGPYVADFLCAEVGLVVELDGGHHDPQRDAPRTAQIEAAGYRVIRFWNHDVLENEDGVLATILTVARELQDAGGAEVEEVPSPNPLPHAGEG